MNVHVMRGSPAELKYRSLGGVVDLEPKQIAAGIAPTPAHDLLFHGGKTIANLTFTNYYVGEKAWNIQDIKNIDAALEDGPAPQQCNGAILCSSSDIDICAVNRATRRGPRHNDPRGCREPRQ